MKETRLMTKTEFLKKKREEFAATSGNTSDQLEEDTRSSPKPTADSVLAVYKHVPKQENPLFTTSTVSVCFHYRDVFGTNVYFVAFFYL